MKYVIGVDLGTSAVKVLLVNQEGVVVDQVSRPYPLIQEKAGYSEQNPEEWITQTVEALKQLVERFSEDPSAIEGLSFSGQMHGLVLLDYKRNVLRNAILWNDTRTTKQCQDIYAKVGKDRYIDITKNLALEGFTLPKLLWVKENEPDIYQQAEVFLLPKDYVRYRLTNQIHMDYSDAAGTGLLDISAKTWSSEICGRLNIDSSLCPPLIESHEFVGTLSGSVAEQTGLSPKTKVFAGGADNACGAIGSGILEEGKTLCSIGTSGVVLSYEEDGSKDYQGKVHFFNHGKEGAFYSMGVTLAAGYSLNWFKETFAHEEEFENLLADLSDVPAGANGLLFTPYIVGERTPHADALIRGSFIGMDSSHKRAHFVRAVVEGITFSLKESIEMFRKNGKNVDSIISIGGGAKNRNWLQIQADIFQADIVKLASEQGPGMGAAMLAAYGLGWFKSLSECASQFIQTEEVIHPNPEQAERYKGLFSIYQNIYKQTKDLNEQLAPFRQ